MTESTLPPASATPAADDHLARRNVLVLASAQALAGAGAPIAISLGGIVGFYLLGTDKTLATLPVTAFVVGTALATLPAGVLAKRFGRRKGLMTGSLIGICGGLLAAYGIFLSFFWLFCLGVLLAGTNSAFVQQYRFAAADTASESFRPKAISWVMAGGVLAGIIGPQTAALTRDLLAPTLFAGAFVGLSALAALSWVVLSFLKFPPVVKRQVIAGGRPLPEIMRQKRFIIAVLCAVSSYALMSFVMTAAPLAMMSSGHGTANAVLGIQWHVLAMFGPSFFTGSLIQRFGKERIVATGLVLLASSAVLALSGQDLANYWGALVVLGVGWNFGFIGATSMLTDTYRAEEKNRVQAVNDFIVFGFVAVASLSSGGVLNAFGWSAINLIVFPIVAIAFAMLFFTRERKAA
uniref:MFS transporter n=1 Tax=Pararhizobium sp. IMCC3301 TaxID=3067904 RepID=UPI0027425A23|nr:MFS transporter [Pararhizobium sp. IMCC3301]